MSRNEKAQAKKRKRDQVEIPWNDDIGYIPRARRIELKPTSKQRRVLKDWCAAVRKTWNLGLDELAKQKVQKSGDVSNTDLRDRFVTRKHMKIPEDLEWIYRTPKRVREYGIIDLVASFKGGFTKLRRKLLKHFTVRHKERDGNETISVSHEQIRVEHSRTIQISGMSIRAMENLPPKIEHNTRLNVSDEGIFLYITEFRSDNEMPAKDLSKREDTIVSLDPGVRKFATFYTQNSCGWIGEDVGKRVSHSLRRIRESWSAKRRAKTIRRLRNSIDDFHWKLCHYLLTRNRVILAPRLWVAKAYHNVKNVMAQLRHCTFVDRLRHKALEYPDAEVYSPNEYMTSRTCGQCGILNGRLGGSEDFHCDECCLEIDRDVNAARNILLKELS